MVVANLQGASALEANFQGAVLFHSNLEKSYFQRADFQGARLDGANLKEALLIGADLQEANLTGANLAGANLEGASLSGANLRSAILDSATILHGVRIGTGPEDSIRIADIRWGGANLTAVNDQGGLPWSGVERLKDELIDPVAVSRLTYEPEVDTGPIAIRAYRQLATALRDQGLVDEANRFGYRAQVLRLQRAWKDVREGHLHRLGAALGFTALWGLAGFGYRPSRPLIWWVGVILVGTLAFYRLEYTFCPCWPPGLPYGDQVWPALIESVNAVHGRGVFFTDGGSPTFAQGAVASVLAVLGLVIEAALIATFTQRFFGR
jgi:hypothetical protein